MDFLLSTADIAVNETVFLKTCEQSVDCNIDLPDYCGDIGKVLKCFVRVNITNSVLVGDRVNVDGVANINLLYLSENKLQNFEHTAPFSTVIDTNCDCAGSVLTVGTSVQYVNCRAINSRKVDVHGAFVISVKLTRCKTKTVVDSAEGGGVEILKDNVMACCSIGNNSENCSVSQVIDIGREKPQIRSVLRNTAIVSLLEKKQVSNKLLVKGELKLSTLYISIDGTVEREENILPISQIVNLPGLEEDSITDVDLNLLSLIVVPKAGATGEVTLLDISAMVSVGVCAYKCKEVPVVTDAYSTLCECTCSKDRVSVDRLIKTTAENFTHSFEIELGSSITRVIDCWCEDISVSSSLVDGKLIYTGKCSAFVLLETASGETVLKQEDTQFQLEDEVIDIQTLKCSPRGSILSCDYTLNESSINIRAIISLKAVVFDSDSLTLIEDIELNEECPKLSSNNLFVYYPDTGEKLWDIARKYNVTLSDLLQQNELEETTTKCQGPLLIWCK